MSAGRPKGAVSEAILVACHALNRPSTRELAEHAKVGNRAAQHAVSNMLRRGELEIVSHRVVPHRRKPIAEYAQLAPGDPPGQAPADLSAVLSNWACTTR